MQRMRTWTQPGLTPSSWRGSSREWITSSGGPGEMTPGSRGWGPMGPQCDGLGGKGRVSWRHIIWVDKNSLYQWMNTENGCHVQKTVLTSSWWRWNLCVLYFSVTSSGKPAEVSQRKYEMLEYLGNCCMNWDLILSNCCWTASLNFIHIDSIQQWLVQLLV